MTGEKNSRWTELREVPITMYMAGAFRSALVPMANVKRLFGRRGYTGTQLSTPWHERKHQSHWHKRSGTAQPFLSIEPGRRELLALCAKAFAAEGKWDHLAILAAVSPVLLVPKPATDEDEIDPSLYVMY